MNHYVGIDIGASHLCTGILNKERTLLYSHRLPITPPLSAADLLSNIKISLLFCLDALCLTMQDICHIGVALPGTVDASRGVILQACNLFVADFPLAKVLFDNLSVPVYLENDANCAALAEYYLGCGANVQNFVLLAIGTGIGGGIIRGKKLLHGCHFGAGEFGHMVIMHDGRPCNCGRRGCFETYASASALVSMTKKAMLLHKDSLLWELCGGRLDAINGEIPFLAQRAGDHTADQIVETYLSHLSCGIGNIINILEPDILCIGGGISREGDHLLSPVIENLRATMWTRNTVPFYTRIVCATLGNDAAMVGATLLNSDDM